MGRFGGRMELQTPMAFIYSYGFRRGSEVALRVSKGFGDHFDRAVIHQEITKYEKLERDDPIFWPFAAYLDHVGEYAWGGFEVGVRDGISEAMKSIMASRLDFTGAH